MWRVLGVGAIAAVGFHLFSVPIVARFTARLMGAFDPAVELETTPIEVIVEEEVVQQQPPPEEKTVDLPPEPAAAADQPSAPPLATAAEPVPTDTRSADTVPTQAAISTEDGVAGGQGAVGDSTAIGLVPGSSEPVVGEGRINLPTVSPPEPVRPRQPVQEVSLARRRATSRQVTCDPCSLPDYPTTERREQVEGQPVINVIFDEAGRVIEAEIEVSSGSAAFDQAALAEARKNWRFRDPQRAGGQVSVDVTFVMAGSEQYAEAQQVGEIRTVELPIQQSIRRVTPAQPSAQPSAPDPTAEVEAPPEDLPGGSSEGSSEDPFEGLSESPLEESSGDASGETAESPPGESASDQPDPSTESSSEQPFRPESVDTAAPGAAPAEVPDAAPEPDRPTPSTGSPSAAEPAPTPAAAPVAPSAPTPAVPVVPPVPVAPVTPVAPRNAPVPNIESPTPDPVTPVIDSEPPSE